MDKTTVTFLLAVLILAFSVWNYIEDDDTNRASEEFYSEIRSFMNKGGRNTASMGYKTCMIQNVHSQMLGVQQRDCCDIYFGGVRSVCDSVDKELTEE